MEEFNYKDIIKYFNAEWDFSYLTFEEMQEVLNFPIKFAPNFIERQLYSDININKDAIFLVVVQRTIDYDYSLNNNFFKICNKSLPSLIVEPFWCNFKYAAVKSGLGQYAKNSLFYHPLFQFETHIGVFLIHNSIKNLPLRQPVNFNFLDQCNGCKDCFEACPANAIHNQDAFIWIDAFQCDNFCFFGNHSTIPSIKWNKIPIEQEITDYQTIFDIQTSQDFFKMFPTANKANYIDNKGQIHNIQYPICRECTSQSKCSKYGGKYPYNWNNVKYKE